MVEVGRCKDCTLETLDVNDPKNKRLVREYGINAVPSIVIDGKIKVVGVPNFPWFCGDEFYRKLEREFPLVRAKGRTESGSRAGDATFEGGAASGPRGAGGDGLNQILNPE